MRKDEEEDQLEDPEEVRPERGRYSTDERITIDGDGGDNISKKAEVSVDNLGKEAQSAGPGNLSHSDIHTDTMVDTNQKSSSESKKDEGALKRTCPDTRGMGEGKPGAFPQRNEGAKAKTKPSYIQYLDPELQPVLDYSRGSYPKEKLPYIHYLDPELQPAMVAVPPEDPTIEEEEPTIEQQIGSLPGAHRQGGGNDGVVGTDVLHNSGATLSLEEGGGGTPSHDDGLVEALPVAADDSADHMTEAQPVEGEDLAQHEAKEERNKLHQRVAMGFVVMALVCLVVLALSLGLALSINRKRVVAEQEEQEKAVTLSPARALPPMEKLELLYENLPESSQESLYERSTPQYAAWDWLLNHPNLSSLEEWRKVQLYAMATFYYSFQGPSWSERIGASWMDESSSECSWISASSFAFFVKRHMGSLEGTNLTTADFAPCTPDGELQVLLLHQLRFAGGAAEQPFMPPEIGLLSSLRIFGMVFGQVQQKLAAILVPELLRLPDLLHLNLAASGVSGTVPEHAGQLTNLLHLSLAYNELTGPVPTELGKLNHLRFLTFFENALSGSIPSQLGNMESLTRLELSQNPLTGTIPSELGSLSNLRRLLLRNSNLTGWIPSELGLLNDVTDIRLGDNDLSGSIPTELWQLSRVKLLHLPNLPNLQGQFPSDFFMPNLTSLDLSGMTLLSGTLPEHIWQLSHLEELHLPNLPSLHGRIPANASLPNLTSLDIRGSISLSGTIPESLCAVPTMKFDCSDLLCGCGCQCS